MKKIALLVTIFVLCFAVMLPVTVSAAPASASLTGPKTVREGDAITLSFKLSGSGLYGASGTLSYDSSQVTLSGTSKKIASPWAVEFNGNNFVAYDNNLSSPINSNKTLFTATFKVKSVAAGTDIKISYTGVKASDGSEDANVGTVTYSVTVAAPLSGDNSLAGLTVSNASISPAFSSGTTSYTADVPFDVTKLNVSATPSDSKAKVSVDNPALSPDATTKVTVTVTSESGSKKTYTISVHRAKDPNYVPSSNNALSGIAAEGFLLSPVFSTDLTQYVVWLPYETENIKISGTAADGKASVEVVGGDSLAAGQDNPVKVICTAENGDKKEYTVIVKRAAAHDGSVDEISPTPENTTKADVLDEDTSSSSRLSWWMLVVVGIACLAIGIGGTIEFNNFRSKSKEI